MKLRSNCLFQISKKETVF